MVSNISNLKVKLLYYASLVSIIGIAIDGFFIEVNESVIILDVITILLETLVIILFYFAIISKSLANAFVIYAVFLNSLISIMVKINLHSIDANLFQSSLLFGILVLYSGFVLKRAHIFILSISQILFYLVITFYSKSEVLLNFLPTTLILLACYLYGMNFIIKMLNDYHAEQTIYISNMHEVNQLLEEKGIELKKLNSTKDKLFSILAHDLRTPANSIMGFAELITLKADALESKSIKDYSNLIYQSSNSLNLLIGELLDWARLQTGSAKIYYKTINMNSIINDTIELMQGTIYLKRINIIFQNYPEIEINADKQMISTIIRNLLNNALKYTPKEGTITIESKIESNQYLFSINDTGIGIDKLTLDNLFSNLSTKSLPGTELEKGTGLGLAICLGFVKLHKGKIWAESELERGSTFSFTIPTNLKQNIPQNS